MDVPNAIGMDSEELVKFLEERRLAESFILLDCRPFMAFNGDHVVNALNVHCPPILKRRSGGILPLENIVPCADKRQKITSKIITSVVVYDQETTELKSAQNDSNLHLVLKSLRQNNDTEDLLLIYLKGKSSFINLFNITKSIHAAISSFLIAIGLTNYVNFIYFVGILKTS